MKSIVITGSTRGIGFGLADAFLARDCRVTISGRNPQTIKESERTLSARYGSDRLLGCPCDVTQIDQVEDLWKAAQSRFGQIDIWINNAGIAHPQLAFWEQEPEQVQALVQTNLLGTMYGVQVALRSMLNQGFGSLYNMEGLGSDGRKVAGLTLYGTTKYALRYLSDALVKETQGTPILIGALSPGMVMTDLITSQYQDRPEDWESAKKIFNILADHVETVTPWLAEKVLANDKTGVRIQWLTKTKIAGRFLSAPFHKRELFE